MPERRLYLELREFIETGEDGMPIFADNKVEEDRRSENRRKIEEEKNLPQIKKTLSEGVGRS